MFFLRKTSTIHISNFCSGMPLRKVHELTFLWFGLPGPLLSVAMPLSHCVSVFKTRVFAHLRSFSYMGKTGTIWQETKHEKTAKSSRFYPCTQKNSNNRVVTFFFPYNPPTPLPRQTPCPSHPEKLDFCPFRLRFAPFRLRFGSVSGSWVGWGWGRGEGLL